MSGLWGNGDTVKKIWGGRKAHTKNGNFLKDGYEDSKNSFLFGFCVIFMMRNNKAPLLNSGYLLEPPDDFKNANALS